jgi:[ribosomal protein S5]-alanine N-acetyltransferase
LLALRLANRAFLAPFDPRRDESFFTIEGQLAWLAAGNGPRFAIVEAVAIAGVLSLSGISRGPLQSAIVGYWVDRERNGRGLASRAVSAAIEVAFGELALHRLEAGTLLNNIASQRVLEHNRFRRIGVARKYLLLDGAWRDHLLFERIADD